MAPTAGSLEQPPPGAAQQQAPYLAAQGQQDATNAAAGAVNTVPVPYVAHHVAHRWPWGTPQTYYPPNSYPTSDLSSVNNHHHLNSSISNSNNNNALEATMPPASAPSQNHRHAGGPQGVSQTTMMAPSQGQNDAAHAATSVGLETSDLLAVLTPVIEKVVSDEITKQRAQENHNPQVPPASHGQAAVPTNRNVPDARPTSTSCTSRTTRDRPAKRKASPTLPPACSTASSTATRRLTRSAAAKSTNKKSSQGTFPPASLATLRESMKCEMVIPDTIVVTCVELIRKVANERGSERVSVRDVHHLDEKSCSLKQVLQSAVESQKELTLIPVHHNQHSFLVAVLRTDEIHEALDGKVALIYCDSLRSQWQTYAAVKNSSGDVKCERVNGLWLQAELSGRHTQQVKNDCSVHMIIKMVSLLRKFLSPGGLFQTHAGTGIAHTVVEFTLDGNTRTDEFSRKARLYIQTSVDNGSINIGDEVVDMMQVTVTAPRDEAMAGKNKGGKRKKG